MSRYGRDTDAILADVRTAMRIKAHGETDRPVIGANSILTDLRDN